MKPQILETQINIVTQVWQDIEKSSQPADRWLGSFFLRNRKKYGSRDRRFISELIYALFRNKLFLSHWAKSLMIGASESEEVLDPHLMVLLGAMTEDLISQEIFERHLSTVPRLRRLDSQSLLRLSENLKAKALPIGLTFETTEKRLAATYSFPEWLINRWNPLWGSGKLEELLGAMNQRPRLSIRVNSLKVSRRLLTEQLQNKGFQVYFTPHSEYGLVFQERVAIFDFPEFKNGAFEVQDEGSQVICSIMNPRPGEIVWDVCAGGGGKSLAIAALMKNKGRIIATDIREKKMEDLRRRAKRAGVYNIFPAALDRLKETHSLKAGADKILIDAPCSGTGTLRRNPDAKWKITPKTFEELHQKQVQIIESALPYLKMTGFLFYATCSLDPRENEEVVQEVLARNPHVKQIDLAKLHLDKNFFDKGCLKLDPSIHGTDGFFMACLKKTTVRDSQFDGSGNP